MPLISPELLSVLRCPVTGSALVQEGEELVAAGPDANGRKLRYRIEDGIPLLLPPELLAAAASASSDQHDGGQHDAGQPGGEHDAGEHDAGERAGARSEGGPRHAAE
ncbi:Trm112 family protein [Arthrobacter sp. B3I4]|uniref:Trm112 family protein n=1 Tax=Arthrobacter sp. B3I4 TaxID=3042267 RepID=UPI0027D8E06C|nr:hypothetical protein [Arthrobacter sp. B3I4]